ncbi:uncharacterized protein LOC136082281 [Hydra vulgaris]|uniref:Uncharacterized protein LOC136082281 n=1 Tax=Hydra vulgaris TaxID=6087 RepID=A0ABM4C635_HYDVU
MLKELVPPIKDRIVFKKKLASKNVIFVRSSLSTLNSCNVSFTMTLVCDINEAPIISEPYIPSDKLTLAPLLFAAVERKEINFSLPKRSKLKEYIKDFLFEIMKQYGFNNEKLHALILPRFFCGEETILLTMTLDSIYPTPSLKIEVDAINPTRIGLVIDGVKLPILFLI